MRPVLSPDPSVESAGGGPGARGGDPHPPLEVEISDTQRHLAIDPERVVQLVRNVLAGEGVHEGSISIAFVDEATIHAVNRRHLEHDCPTDVISFRLSDPDDRCLSGELVISAERAKDLAQRYGVDPWAELALYVVHGLLHHCGFDDVTDSERERMRRRESEVLAREGLMNTFPLAGVAEAPDVKRESARWLD